MPTIHKVGAKTTRQQDGSLEKMKYETGKDTRIKENVWIYECGSSKSTTDTIAFKHPAIFPEKLAYDHIRSWSNENDLVYEFLIKNKNSVDKSLFAVYEERNKSHKKLLNLTEIKKSIYDTCSSMSKKNKLKDYWINIWGDSKNYSENSIIENIVI